MGAFDTLFTHTCQVLKTYQDYKLSFTNGSAVFTAAKTVTGATSHATGIIKSVTLSSGSWAAGTAAGYIIIYTVTGTFTTGETIQDNNTTKGTAKASGSQIAQSNAAGTPTTTQVTLPTASTYYDCFFSKVSLAGNSVSDSVAGKVIISTPFIMLPASAVVEEGDQIVTTQTGWAGTYEVQPVDSPEIPGSDIVDHKEAFLKKVGKRG